MTNADGMHLALPEWQRVRLRPDVDVPSLERFLEELPASARPTVLRHFEPDVLPRTDQREDRSSMSGTQAEERVRLHAEEADYVHIALRTERQRRMYELIFLNAGRIEKQRLLVTRIPYVRWPRVYIDAVGGPALDDFTADPAASHYPVDSEPGANWLLQHTRKLPRGLGQLQLRLPPEYVLGIKPSDRFLAEGSEHYRLGTWRASTDPNGHQLPSDRTVSLWVAPTPGYPFYAASTTFTLGDVNEWQLGLARWTTWAISCSLIAPDDRRKSLTAAYWSIDRDLWIQAFWEGPPDSRDESLTILATAEIRSGDEPQ